MKQEIKQKLEQIKECKIPEGYKETKMGIIPKDWSIKEINKITDYADYRGKTPPKTKEGVFLVTAKNIKKGFIDYNASKEFVSNKEYSNIMKRGLPKKGDVLITTEAPVGNVAQIDNEKIALAQRVIKYRGKKGIIDNTYLKYFCLGNNFQKEILIESTGGTVKGIKGSRLHKMNIVYPIIDEQKKINKILTTSDCLIELKNEEIKNTKKLKKGLMQNLLEGKVRFPEFKNNWQNIKLKKLLIEVSKRNNGNNVDRVLSVNNKKGFINQDEQFGKQVASADVSNYKIIKKGQFAYNPSRINVGSIDLLKNYDEGILSPMYVVFDVRETLNSEYFRYWLETHEFKGRMKSYISGSVRDSLGFKDMCAMIIKIPPREEQNKIVKFIGIIDREIIEFEKELYLLKEQKKGLMQLLLTGIIRVNTD
jgi:type I restriction enzyme, S subunit